MDSPSEAVCLDGVAGSDALLLILDRRYGFIPPKRNPDGLSVTHCEYRTARDRGLRIYAFLRERPSRQPELEAFISEIADYHDGHFRRTWSTDEELRSEARRSALAWLAEDLRSGQMAAASGLVTAELGHFPLVVDNVDLFAKNRAAWLSKFIEGLETKCRDSFLPLPLRETVEDARFWLRVGTVESTSDFRIKITLERTSSGGERCNPIECEFGLSLDEVGSASEVAASLVRAGVGDSSGSISGLIATTGQTVEMKEALLGCASQLSIAVGGRMSERIAVTALDHESLLPETVRAVFWGLTLGQLRYENRGALQAAEHLQRLMIDLCLKHPPEDSNVV